MPLKAADREITLADLATHTSGLPRLPENFKPAHLGNPCAEYSLSQLRVLLEAGKSELTESPAWKACWDAPEKCNLK